MNTHLDEGTRKQETVGQANLNATQQGRDASAVRGQAAEEACDQRRGCHGRLQHAHEGVAIDGLHHLGLQILNNGVVMDG